MLKLHVILVFVSFSDNCLPNNYIIFQTCFFLFFFMFLFRFVLFCFCCCFCFCCFGYSSPLKRTRLNFDHSMTQLQFNDTTQAICVLGGDIPVTLKPNYHKEASMKMACNFVQGSPICRPTVQPQLLR